MGGKSVNTSATRAEALTLQSSTYGATITWLRGMHRLPGNLLWYGDFKATPHTQQQGGKGGGGKNTTYTYSASMVMGLCHGAIADIPSVWKGKSRTTIGALGLTKLSGSVGQAVWSGLLGKGSESIGYSGIAGVAVQAYELGDSASLENHAFEVRHASAYSVHASTPDVDPAQATRELMVHPLQGAGLPEEIIGDWSAWSDYCVAAGLLMSPMIDTQVEASEALERVADLTNTAIVWSDGKLQMRPYGDERLTGLGRVYEPETVPVYELDDTCYLVENGGAPVVRSLKTPADCFNQVSVSYKDRQNAYNEAVVTAKDLTDISVNGVRAMDTVQAPWITEGSVARLVAELKKQRSLMVLGEYTFKLPINYALVECMDLLTLTEEALALEGVPVRVKEIVEESDFELTITCEDYPAGVASAPRYPVQTPAGFAEDAYAAPGSVVDAAFFEAPAAMASGPSGLEVWVAVQAPTPNWGGCTVHVSLDGTTYRAVGRLEGPSRMGLLSDEISSGQLKLHAVSGQLVGASLEDAQALTTLSVVLGAQPEYLAYQNALLVGAGAYTLTGLVRGAYSTPASVHAPGDRFVRIDESVGRSGGLDASYIGKRIWFKLTSFNLYGGAEQSLAEVDEMAYDVTGVFAKALPGLNGRGVTLKASAQTIKQSEGGVRLPAAVTLTAELGGTLVGTPVWTVEDGAATLSGSGLQRTVDTSTITTPARIRVTVVDSVANYSDEVTLQVVADGDEGAAGADGSKFTLVSLYQWSTIRPSAPNGKSTWTWATASQTDYTGGAGWQIGIPANPGVVGLQLWAASKQISAAGGTLKTDIAWGADATVAAVGANGDGVQVGEAAVYTWAANLASIPALQGTSEFTWSTGGLSQIPAGWSLAPGASVSPGMTLFKASVRLTDAASSPETLVNWTLAAVFAVGYAGTSGAPGQAGASARVAYAKVTGTTIGSGPVETVGAEGFPPDGAWGRNEHWAGTLPEYGADESVMVTNGVYSPTSGKTVWSSPYLAAFRVGKLSAITADIGDITAGTFNIGGRFQVSSDGYFSAKGGQILDESGNVIFSTRSEATAQLPSNWVTPAVDWLNSSNASGANLIPNSDQATSVTMAWGNAAAGSIDVGLQYASNLWDSVYTLKGVGTRNLTIHQNNNNGSGDGGVGVDIYPMGPWDLAHSVPAIPGQRYCMSCYFQAHRCSGGVGIQFFAADGNFISEAYSGPVAPTYPATPSADSLSLYRRPFVIATAPPNAFYLRPYVRKHNTWNGGSPESWFWLAAPQLEIVGSTASGPGVYSPGPALLAGRITRDVATSYFDNAIFDAAHIRALSAGLISTGINGGTTNGIQVQQNILAVFNDAGAEIITLGRLS